MCRESVGQCKPGKWLLWAELLDDNPMSQTQSSHSGDWIQPASHRLNITDIEAFNLAPEV